VIRAGRLLHGPPPVRRAGRRPRWADCLDRVRLGPLRARREWMAAGYFELDAGGRGLQRAARRSTRAG